MAFRPSVAVALLLLVGGHALPSRLVDVENVNIIGGDETTIEKFPYQIALSYFDNFRCGGSVINADFVLTAAHCLYNVKFDWHVTIRAGSTSRIVGGQNIKATKTLFEPRFTMTNLQFDVGLVKLENPLTFNDAVRPVNLVAVGAEPKPGQTITLSGWGLTDTASREAPLHLRTVKVNVVRRWVCAMSYVLTAKVTDAMFCASASGKDSCQGDSGGPAVDDAGNQVGIVSFGNGCANWLFPGVYTNLANAEVRAFIDKAQSSM